MLSALNDALRDHGADFRHIPVTPADLHRVLAAVPVPVPVPVQEGSVKDQHLITLNVNGRTSELLLESRKTLADVLRQDLGLTGTHLGCEHGICGACTVLLDGAPVAFLPDFRRTGRRP